MIKKFFRWISLKLIRLILRNGHTHTVVITIDKRATGKDFDVSTYEFGLVDTKLVKRILEEATMAIIASREIEELTQ